MEAPSADLGQVGSAARRIIRRLLTIGENRIVLLAVEVQEERTRLLHVVLIALGVAIFGLLGVTALSTLVVVLLWSVAPVAALLGLAIIYGMLALGLCWRMAVLLRDWHTFPASLEQLRKDRACLDAALA